MMPRWFFGFMKRLLGAAPFLPVIVTVLCEIPNLLQQFQNSSLSKWEFRIMREEYSVINSLGICLIFSFFLATCSCYWRFQRRKSMGTVPHGALHKLNNDVLIDIIARLPAKSLVRFMSVSKSWRSMIHGPEFISAHYTFSKRMVSPLIKYFHRRKGKNMVSLVSNQSLELTVVHDVPNYPSVANYIQCCRGLICIYESPGKILLWNPATKEHKILPKHRNDLFPLQSDYEIRRNIGLGYNSKSNNYTVLRIDLFWENLTARRGIEVALYSLSTDSWRELDANLNIELKFSTHHPNAISSGFYHCLAELKKEEVLLSFDFSNEVFITTPFPDGHFGRLIPTHETFFMEISGSLGGLCGPRTLDETAKSYDVWILGKVGIQSSWKKLFTVGPILNVVEPIGAGNNVGEFFFVCQSTNSTFPKKFLVWHRTNEDGSEQETKRFQLEEVGMQQTMYAESIVSVWGRSSMFNH